MEGKRGATPGDGADSGTDHTGGTGTGTGRDGEPRTPPASSPSSPISSASSSHELRRRRLAAAAWVCAVAAAFLLGAWSFSHADPGGQYARHAPIDEAGVQRELTQAEQRARTRSPAPSTTPSDSAASPEPSRDATGSTGPTGTAGPTGSPASPRARTSTVRFPDGTGTAVAECRTDARTVKLLSWSPAEGYSADDVEPGPAAEASVELEPVDDDAEDRTVLVRCRDGKPRSAFAPEPVDDSDDADDD